MSDFEDEEIIESLSAIPEDAEALEAFQESDDSELVPSISALEGDASSKGIKRRVSQEELDRCYQKIEEDLEKWVIGDSGEDAPDILLTPDPASESTGLVDRGLYKGKNRKQPVLGVDRLLVISSGIEAETYRGCDQVNHGYKGLVISIASCS